MKNLIYNITIILVIAIEVIAGYWFITGPALIRIIAGGLHIVMVCLGGYLFKKLKMKNFQADDNFIYVTVFLSFILPFYGLLGMYLVTFAMNSIKFKPVDYFETDDSLIPDRYQMLLRYIDRNVTEIKRDELDIEAFKDIFKTNDRLLEENAINKLSKIVTRDSVSVLQDVVKHATTDSKILAATALIDMEDKIIQKIEDIRTQRKENPNNSELILELARTYDLYCYLGVLDEAIENYYRMLALEQYRTFLILHPKHPQATFEYGRVLLNYGDIKKAVRVLKAAVALTPQNPNPYIWLAEAHYESGDYKAVTALCQKLNRLQNMPENFKPVTSWWTKANIRSED